MTRRDLIALGALPLLAQEKKLPTAPVSIRKCDTYNEDFYEIFTRMFDDLGGVKKLVANKK